MGGGGSAGRRQCKRGVAYLAARPSQSSPNSAQTESACAGALGVQLAGPAYYFGAYYDKPTIGDALRPIEAEDILRADRMMYTESVLALIIGLAVRFALMM